MTRIFKVLLVLISFCYVSLFADAPVWKVSKDGNHIYIAGTMHILSKDDYPLKHQFKQAFLNSDELVFETDINALESAQFQRALFEAGAYKNGKSLKNFLSAKTYNELKAYFRLKKIPPQLLAMKPGFIMSTISMILYNEHGLNFPGVDDFMEEQARKHNKKVYFLETVEEQLAFISKMGVGNEENFIRYTLEDVKNAHIEIPLLHKTWLEGDVKLLSKEIMDDFKVKFPKAYDSLLVERNNNWLPKIEKMFDTKSIEYVLVGFAHLAGEDSLLLKLENLGYKIQRVKVTH